jgi:hypothetical protein
MKRFSKRNLFLILIFLFLVLPFGSMAQVSGDPGDPGCNPYGYRRDENGNWVLCPIDDGIYALLGIGVLYGIKKVKDSRKQTAEADIQ